MIEGVLVCRTLFSNGPRVVPAIAVFVDHSAVSIRLRERGSGSDLGCALALFPIASRPFRRRALAYSPRRALSETELGLEVGCSLHALLEPIALALGDLEKPSLFRPAQKLRPLALARR